VLDDTTKTLDLLVREGRRLVDRGADVLILGCISLGLGPFTAELSDALQIPVINPVRAAIAAAQVFQTVGPPVGGRPEDYGQLRSYLPAVERSLSAAHVGRGE
jgi:hypothetical protein